MSVLEWKFDLPLDAPLTLSGLPEGYDAAILGDLARRAREDGGRALLHVASDDGRAEHLKRALEFFHPGVKVLLFPAWDCLPFDRVGPKADILSTRIGTLIELASGKTRGEKPVIILTTLNAALQRVPPAGWISSQALTIRERTTVARQQLSGYFTENGYLRVEAVAEPGDYAFRGGLVDLYPPHAPSPYRLDLFGDEVESIRTFDPLSQRTIRKVKSLELLPAREFGLDEASRENFRESYIQAFGPPQGDDPLYLAIREGRPHPGADHWLALFHGQLETLFDYARGAVLTLDTQVRDVVLQRLDDIQEYYLARKDMAGHMNQWSVPYKALPPERLYLTGREWESVLEKSAPKYISPYPTPEGEAAYSFGGTLGRSFIAEREQKDKNLFEAVAGHMKALQKAGKTVLIGAADEGSAKRLFGVFADHGIKNITLISEFSGIENLKTGHVALAPLQLDKGFETNTFALITETDILGDRLPRRTQRRRKAENFLKEASALTIGDLVVHVSHGIGRFAGLEAVTAAGARHDCLKLLYQGGDRLFVPVENIEMLSRYGDAAGEHLLDKLGGTAWQARHAKLKKRIREMADKLIEIAAARSLKDGPVMAPPGGIYEEFSARFPYSETEDQLKAIDDVLGDLQLGRPMDRLICGDVGFGKTEVALRATLAAVMAGFQVAVITPTTLLSRQHFNTFSERYQGLPVVIEELSRLVPAAAAKITRKLLSKGQVDIIIGTHALLSREISFKNLGLLIVDEEQHFGVSHKERLKALKSNVHVLTLSATPIPRTLQMSLAGLKEMSLIATPPVDRLAIRTYVMPADEVVIREALLREHYRGGQSYYVCPRIADLKEVAEFLTSYVPEVKFAIAHGQMPPRRLEDAMTAFYEGGFDVLLSTSIIESGLDIANANTLIIHRADMFGLAQLYQLRGRVGRSKVRAYAYLTTPPRKPLTGNAEKRLHVLQSLDSLGAGFTLAAHDMDIRGAGNLLGEEQSGQVKEVGVELYQKMLEQAVAERRTGTPEIDGKWSPVINLGASVLIPENFVEDLGLRLALYRRLSTLDNREEIKEFGAELEDRFGGLPAEVRHLLFVTEIKLECLGAGIARIETGPKGVIITFHKDQFKNPAGLADLLQDKKMKAKLRPDHKLIIFLKWSDIGDRLLGVLDLVKTFRKIAEAP
ncbi:MAG: transcription-repair coupling factor [Sphingomonadales bacterium]